MFFSQSAKARAFGHLTKCLTAAEIEVERLTSALVKAQRCNEQLQADLDQYVVAVGIITAPQVMKWRDAT